MQTTERTVVGVPPGGVPPVNTPFFLVGAQRSGTTLLRLMLAAHPRLAIPPESHFIPDLLRIERVASGLDGIRSEIADLLVHHDRLVDFELGSQWIRDTVLRLQPLTTRTITAALFTEYARRRGKARWGDKTPRYRNHLPELSVVFPDAKFVHVVRDGRDTALSSWRAAFGPRTLVEAGYLWRDSVRAARAGAQRLRPGAVHEVRYEALVRNPEATLREICAFLGETFDQEMLRYAEHAGSMVPRWERAWHAKLERPVEGANAGKWRTELSRQQIFLLERVAGKELEAFGYAPTRLRIPAREAAQAFVECANYRVRRAAARAAAWARGPQPLMTPTAHRPAEPPPVTQVSADAA
jgi:hypothetical protein